MEPYRYDQFCALARAAEVLGPRWTLPILRELSVGPARFSDLRTRLPGLSSSVLTQRLAALEGYAVVERGAGETGGGVLYRLTPHGEALRPILHALTRWGLCWLGSPRRGDHFAPEWLQLALEAFAAPGPTPPYRYELQVSEQGRARRLRFAGGRRGTHALAASDRGAVDATVEAPALLALGLVSGRLSAAAARRAGARISGDATALDALCEQFDFEASSAPVPRHRERKKGRTT